MKSFTKIFAMMLVVVMVVGMFSTIAFAADDSKLFSTTADSASSSNLGDIDDKVNDIGNGAMSLIKTLGGIIAVIMVFIYAIKWMMATPQKKQELKERLWYLAIGVILLVAGPYILDAIGTAAGMFK